MRNLRPAIEADIPALEALIEASVRVLQAADYSEAQREAALGPVFGVDRQLISDRTYFVIESDDGAIIACGGWSQRLAMFGGDRHRLANSELLDPAKDPARIRAFFVHPDWARRGLGRQLLLACEDAARAAGFRVAEMAATLTGVPLYRAHGYEELERYDFPLANGLPLPIVRMRKSLVTA